MMPTSSPILPQSLKELVENPNGPKIVLQDPRTSAPGLGFMLWMRKVYGDQAGQAWTQLKPRVVTFTKGWSEAYGLFMKGEADMVLSYTTSPAYHVVAEKKDNFKAAEFRGRPLSPRRTGWNDADCKTTGTRAQIHDIHPVGPFQSAMPEGNWMMPAKMPASGLPAPFKDVVKPASDVVVLARGSAAKSPRLYR